MRKTKRHSGIKNYLDTLGVIERGSEEDINNAKKAYWKQRNTEIKRKQRAAKRHCTVSMSNEEYTQLEQAAKARGLQLSAFLKQATNSYLQKIYVIPHISVLHHIEQMIFRSQTGIERIANSDKVAWYKADRKYQDLEEIIKGLHRDIGQIFAQPPTLERTIEQALQNNPDYALTIKKLLASYDCKTIES